MRRGRLSSKVSFFFAVLILLAAAALRMNALTTLPPGLHDGEIIDIRIAETAREGTIEVFYDLNGEGRESLYHLTLTFVTSLTGNGPLGYRMFSVWVGMLAVAGVYALGKRLFGYIGGLAAMSLMAFTFYPVVLSRQITRETALPLMFTIILLALTLVLPVYRRRRRRSDNTSAAAVLGAFLGFTLYLHPVGIALVFFSTITIAYMVISRQQLISRRRLSYILFALLVMVIISMPYVISTIRRPQLSGFDRLTGTDYPAVSLTSAAQSIGGIFWLGDPNPINNLPQHPLLDPVMALLVGVGLFFMVREWRNPRHLVLLIALLCLSPIFLFATKTADFIHFAAVLPLLALFYGLGVSSLRRIHPQYGSWAAIFVLLISLSLTLYRTWTVLFEDWAENAEVAVAYNSLYGQLAHYIDRTADSIPTVLCGWRLEQSPTALTLSDAQLITLMMNNRDAPLRQANCATSLIMTNGGANEQIVLPSSTVWQEAHPEILRWLSLGEPVADPGIPAGSVLKLNVEQALADRIGLLTVETPVRYAPEVGGSRDELVYTPVNFGGNLTFLGYVLDSDVTYEPGDVMTLVTYWRVAGPVPPDLRLFTHVLSDPGAAPPANTDTIGVSPRMLRDRDVFIQVTYVPLPSSLPEGEYAVSIGAYQATSDDRLSVLVDGTTRGTRLFLINVEVVAG
ncbi:MAG: hypothetical protein OHK0046_31750 [Anaerolineae bacterium]